MHPPFKKQDEDRGAGIGIGIATGGILGALIGHYAFDKCEVTTTTTTTVTPPPPPPPPVTKKKIVLRGVNFDFNKSNIRRDAVPILDEAVKTLKDNPGIRVEVDGYTDSIGSVAYNLRLSQRRADSVRRYLSRQDNLPLNRMSSISYGDTLPVAPNKTKAGRAQNRRVVIVVLE